MFKTLILSAFLIIVLACNQSNNLTQAVVGQNKSQSHYYFIRHAEKEAQGEDPDLTKKGIQQAKQWASYFKDKSLHSIYSTDYKRTQHTAKIIAEELQLKVTTYDANTGYTDQFKRNTANQNVLIVGHSNTIPNFANAILGQSKFSDISEDTYNLLIKVSKIQDSITGSVTTVTINN